MIEIIVYYLLLEGFPMHLDPLASTLILLATGVVALGFAHAAKVSAVIGFIVAGALIGPYGFKLADPAHGVLHVLAELGVCFLLFDAGLHISLTKLRARWRAFLTLGGLQMLASGAAIGGAAWFLGVGFLPAVVIGGTLALSSTAIVLKQLHDEHEEDSPVGMLSTEILVFQDLAGIFLLVLLGSFGSSDEAPVTIALRAMGNMILVTGFVLIGSRFLARPFFQWVSSIKADEVFTASALLFVLVTCWLTQSLGLSLALGAFLAGVTLSESNYSFLVRSEVAPFRGLLLSLFFLSVGMSIDLGLLTRSLPAIFIATLGLIALKSLALFAVARTMGIASGPATLLSALLAQGSEFAFVVLAVAATSGILKPEDVSFLGTVVSMSMVLTPFFSACGCKASRVVAKSAGETDETVLPSASGEIIIVEFDEVGRELASALQDAGLYYRGHDRDWDRISYGRSRGFNVHFSDPNRPRTLSRVSVGQVRAVVCLIEDDNIARYLIESLHKMAPTMPIFAATRELSRLELYEELGVESPAFKNSACAEVLFENVLQKLGFSEEAIEALKLRNFREESDSFFPRGTELDPVAGVIA